jgi:uroporphyrinogen-III synthase
MGTAIGGGGTRIGGRRFRALVTRPRAEAVELAAALAARGIAALIEPLLDIHYRDVSSPDLAGVQAIVCTSANGVRALARLTAERRLPLFAVGDASATQARDAGFAGVESAGGDSRELARLIGERLSAAAGKLLHVAGSEVAGDLAGDLRARGFAVERAVLYEARPMTTLSTAASEALTTGSIDYALFFSPRTAAIFAQLVIASGLAAAIRAITAVSISAAANAALDPLAFSTRAVAARPHQGELLAVLDRLVGERSGA